jgi:hypothetical protein
MRTGIVAVFLDTTIVHAAIDSLSSHLHTTVDTTRWVISGHVLATGAETIIVTGRPGARRNDSAPRRRHDDAEPGTPLNRPRWN